MSRSFYFLWTSNFISQIGNWFYMIALPLEVYRLTGSAFHMATIFGVEFLPWILFSLVGGLLADRVDRRKLLIGGNLLAGGLVIVLMNVLYLETIPMVLLYIAVFCLASINPMTHPSFQSVIPRIVPSERLVKANSAMQFTDNVISFIGPMIGGTLVALVSGSAALTFDAVSFFAAALLLWPLPSDSRNAQDAQGTKSSIRKRLSADIMEGLRHVGVNKVVLYGSLLFVFTNLAINLFQSNYYYFLANTLELNSKLIGLTIGLSGLGPIAGSFIAPYLNKRFSPGRLILLSTASAGVLTFLLLMATSYWQVALIQAAVLAFGSVNVITYFSLRQRVVPSHLLGRVVSVTRMISYTTIPIGAFVGGFMVEKGISIYWLIVAGGVIRLVVGLVGFLTPLNDSKRAHSMHSGSQTV